jgi:O-antigen/teichoic acid export membrane protein
MGQSEVLAAVVTVEPQRSTAAPDAAAPTVLSTSKPKSAIVNAGWNAFYTVWSSGISLILTPWLVGHLGLDYYGILLIVWSLTGVLGVMNLGLGEATLRYVALYYGKHDLPGINRVLGSTLALYLGASLAVSTVLLFAAPSVAAWLKVTDSQRPIVEVLVRMTAAVVTLGILSRTVGAVPAALQRYDVSTKVNVVQSVARFGGYLLIAGLGFGVVHLVLWDIVTLSAMLCVQFIVARSLLPGLVVRPNFSRHAARELIGYSVFSFLTYVFHTTHREAAKLLTGRFLGPAGVSLVGVPDSLSQRVHGVVASAGETLLPRFSATGDRVEAMRLFWNSTWAAALVTATVFVPYTIVLPDFLKLWIGADFARQAAVAGQLVALSYVTQSFFVPAATLARGSGKPGIVTAVIFVCGMTMLTAGITLIPRFGLNGVAICYVMGSVPAAFGTIYVARRFFDESSGGALFRSLVVPLVTGALALALASLARGWYGELHWVSLLVFAGSAAVITAILVLAAEHVIGGGDSRTGMVMTQVRRRLRIGA